MGEARALKGVLNLCERIGATRLVRLLSETVIDDACLPMHPKTQFAKAYDYAPWLVDGMLMQETPPTPPVTLDDLIRAVEESALVLCMFTGWQNNFVYLANMERLREGWPEAFDRLEYLTDEDSSYFDESDCQGKFDIFHMYGNCSIDLTQKGGWGDAFLRNLEETRFEPHGPLRKTDEDFITTLDRIIRKKNYGNQYGRLALVVSSDTPDQPLHVIGDVGAREWRETTGYRLN